MSTTPPIKDNFIRDYGLKCGEVILDELGGIDNKRTALLQGIVLICCFATTLFASIGTWGVFSNSTLGMIFVGLGATSLLAQLASGNFAKRKFTILIGVLLSLIPLIFGSYGMAHTMAAKEMARWVLSSSTITCFLVSAVSIFGSVMLIRVWSNSKK